MTQSHTHKEDEALQVVTDEQADEIANACYRDLLPTGYNGGMGGQTWDRALVRAAIAASRAPVAVGVEPTKLWLWKNFVDGKPEYWAFDNPFPINLNDGDPQTLGEPCGYAVFKPSRQGRTDVSEEQVLRDIAGARPNPPTERDGLTSKEAWWAGYREGKGLPPDTPRHLCINSPGTPSAGAGGSVGAEAEPVSPAQSKMIAAVVQEDAARLDEKGAM